MYKNFHIDMFPMYIHIYVCMYKMHPPTGHWWLTPIILVIQEAEVLESIKRIVV
jgi:hypothetical protein